MSRRFLSSFSLKISADGQSHATKCTSGVKQEHDSHAPASDSPPPPPPFSLRDRLRPHLDHILPKLDIPAAILVAAAITAGTTYALVRRVQHLIATATVSSDPEVWLQAARTQAYDSCYLGCSDCDDTTSAWNACARTAAANVTGTICDTNRKRNRRDRYPVVWLRAVGELYKAAD